MAATELFFFNFSIDHDTSASTDMVEQDFDQLIFSALALYSSTIKILNNVM